MTKATRICIKCEMPGKFATQTIGGRKYTRTTCVECRKGYMRDLRQRTLKKSKERDRNKMKKFRRGPYYKANPHKLQFTKAWSRLHPEKYLFITMQRRKAKPGDQYKLKMTFDEFKEEIGGEVPKICPVLGIEMFIDDESHSGHLPTIDRIDNQRAYEKGNIAVISRRANIIKSIGTAEDHRRIAEWMDRQKGDPSV